MQKKPSKHLAFFVVNAGIYIDQTGQYFSSLVNKIGR